MESASFCAAAAASSMAVERELARVEVESGCLRIAAAAARQRAACDTVAEEQGTCIASDCPAIHSTKG
jgi:Holliday junction resolvase